MSTCISTVLRISPLRRAVIAFGMPKLGPQMFTKAPTCFSTHPCTCDKGSGEGQEGFRRGSGGGQEGIYRSSLDA
eukprot:715073-Pyramimonas_sp.AAC.1